MFLKFENHIQNHFTFLENKKILVAVSGGVDSMVLLYLLKKLNYTVCIAHCNFKLRGKAADKDEAFVIEQAEKLNVPCFTTTFDTNIYAEKNKISIQMAARELRYDWFAKLLKQQHIDYLLTAHHLDDALETFLINLSRGTGLSGLIGIPEKKNKTIRPLLIFERKDIEQYALDNHIPWREDQSNSDVKYLRNKIRHHIVPLLKELSSNFSQSFSQTIAHLKGSQQIINQYISKLETEIISDVDSGIKINIEKLNSLSNPAPYLFELLKKYGFTQWQDINELLTAQSGKQVFSKTHVLTKDRKSLILSSISKNESTNPTFIIHENDTDLTFEPKKNKTINFNISHFKNSKPFLSDLNHQKDVAYFDKDLLKFPLLVRNWQKGDYFYPLGMQGKKKLSKFFKDEKVSLLEKKNILLLCAENQIVWVIGKRIDNRFRVSEKTKTILKIEIKS